MLLYCLVFWSELCCVIVKKLVNLILCGELLSGMEIASKYEGITQVILSAVSWAVSRMIEEPGTK